MRQGNPDMQSNMTKKHHSQSNSLNTTMRNSYIKIDQSTSARQNCFRFDNEASMSLTQRDHKRKYVLKLPGLGTTELMVNVQHMFNSKPNSQTQSFFITEKDMTSQFYQQQAAMIINGGKQKSLREQDFEKFIKEVDADKEQLKHTHIN